MKITERRLRHLIRNVIKESLDMLPGKSFSTVFTHDNKKLFDKSVLDYCKHSARLLNIDEDLMFSYRSSPHECFAEEVYDMSYHSNVEGKKVFNVITQELPTQDRSLEVALQWRFETDENTGFIVTLKISRIGERQELTCERLFSDNAGSYVR